MCSEPQFDTIFKVLRKKDSINVEPFDKEVFSNTNIKISSKDALDGFERLQKLGFANMTTYLDGTKTIKITDQGKSMYKAIF